MKVINSNPIPHARKILANALIADPDYKRAWIDNLAMFMYDNINDNRLNDKAFRDTLANQLLKLIFF